MSQSWSLTKYSFNILCPNYSEILIASEMKVCQRWTLHQNSCNPLDILSFHFTSVTTRVPIWNRTVISVSCLETNWPFPFSVSLPASSQKLLLKWTTSDRSILSTMYILPHWETFESLRGPSQHDRPSQTVKSFTTVVRRDDSQKCSQDVSSDQPWFRFRR